MLGRSLQTFPSLYSPASACVSRTPLPPAARSVQSLWFTACSLQPLKQGLVKAGRYLGWQQSTDYLFSAGTERN